jgi:hypothetical protein
VRADISRECNEKAGRGEVSLQSKDLDPTRNTRDQTDITTLMSTMESMVNPFNSENDQLVHLSSGVMASKEMADDVAGAKCKDEVAVQAFIADRLKGNDVDFFAPIKRLN